MAKKLEIHKNTFDAALTPKFRELVKAVYAEMTEVQVDIATQLKTELSNGKVWQQRNCPICGGGMNKAPYLTSIYTE